ncbi:DUF115 domain-containing protein [Paradesulfitobacterium aromaticivorans]
MKTLYEKNLAFLISQGFQEKDLKIVEKNSTLQVYSGERGYYTARKAYDSQSALLHSEYDPLFEAEQSMVEEDFSLQLSVFLFGLGLGYQLVEVLGKTRSDCLIFVLESDWEVIQAAMFVIDFEEILASGRVVLAFGTPSEIRLILDGLFIILDVMIKLHHMNFVYFAPKYRFELEWVQEVRRLVMDTFRYHRQAMGIDVSWPIDGLKNLTDQLKPILRSPFPSVWKGKWKRPIVIALAGPSLAKNIDVLKQWQDKVTIFCVNTSFNKLLDSGVVPDATFSLDRTPLIPELHYVRDEIPESIVFVSNPVVDARCVSRFKHTIYVLGGGEYYENELAEALGSQCLPVGLSVTHMAFSFARHCGAAPIILIGQDLALGEGGNTHSEGTVYETDRIERDSPGLVQLEGYYGEKVPSTLSWKAFRDWYEDFLEKFPTLLINATEGGARIKGTMQMSLEETLEKYVGNDAPVKPSFNEWVDGMVEKTEADFLLRLGQVESSFEQRVRKLESHERELSRAIILCERITDSSLNLTLKKGYLDKVLNIFKDVSANDSWVYSLFRPEYVRIMSEMEISNSTEIMPDLASKQEVLQAALISLKQLLSELKLILNKSLSSIQLRLEE